VRAIDSATVAHTADVDVAASAFYVFLTLWRAHVPSVPDVLNGDGTMTRTSALVIALLVTGAHAIHAQPAVKRTADSLTTRFVGVWDGQFVSDHGVGGMQLTVSRDTAWSAAIEMAHGDMAIPTLVRDVKVDGNTISWNQYVMGMTCAASATVDGTSMTGDAACGQVSFKIELQKK
jgi:hypothetical protein